MRRALLVVAFMGMVATARAQTPKTWDKEPTAYRGMEWGAPFAQAHKFVDNPSVCICQDTGGAYFGCPQPLFAPLKPNDVPDRRSCKSSLAVAGIDVEDLLHFEEDRLVGAHMEFSEDEFDKMKEIFVEKYGRPMTSSTSDVTNRMGAHFTNESVEWRGARVTVSLDRYGSDLRKSSANIALNTFTARIVEEEKKRRKQGTDAF